MHKKKKKLKIKNNSKKTHFKKINILIQMEGLKNKIYDSIYI